MILYGIKNCDSVKKARDWLEQRDIDYQFHDFRVDGLTEQQIRQWLQQQPWEQLLNKRSTTWRQLDDSLKNNMSESTAIPLMLEHPTLIKRPVLTENETCLVGFNETQYQNLL